MSVSLRGGVGRRKSLLGGPTARLAVGFAALVGAAGAAQGANIVWTGGAIGEYQLPFNWAGEMVPDFGDTAIFNTSPTMEIDFTADATLGRLLHGDGDLILNLNGNQLTLLSNSNLEPSWTSSASVVGEGDVAIVGGTVSGVFANIGDSLNDASRVMLSDPAARLEMSESLRVGAFGFGSLSLENGASCEVFNDLIVGETLFGQGSMVGTGSDVSVSITDQLQVGAQGTGLLRMLEGATATCANFFIAAFAGSDGETIVSGAGSAILVGNTIGVGFNGPGELRISLGGTVTGMLMRVGFDINSTGLVSVIGAGSLLDIDASVIVGASGDGELLVSDGGTAQLGELTISTAATTASVIVEGAGSTLDVSGQTSVGTLESGVLEVRSDGQADLANVTIGTAGLLALDGGVVNCSALTVQGDVQTPERGALIETGVFGRGEINGEVTVRGRMTPDPFESVISVNGPLTYELGSVLTLRVRASTGSTPLLDRVVANGPVTLGGTLVVQREVFLSPLEGTRVRIIDGATSVAGAFERIESPPLPGGLRWITVGEPGGVDLIAAREGDLNGDGVVDASDLARLIGAWGQADASADFDGDGEVGPSDLAALIGAWG